MDLKPHRECHNVVVSWLEEVIRIKIQQLYRLDFARKVAKVQLWHPIAAVVSVDESVAAL